ncbi:unnamed protein product, partial [Effrenium voratum]
ESFRGQSEVETKHAVAMLGVLPSSDGTQAEAPLPSAEGEPPELARAPTCDALAASLRQCLLGKCLYADVKSVLESRADPNCSFKYKLGPKEFQGTPLTLAVKLDKPNVVRLLFASQADPESCYSMSAGRKGVHWHGPAVCGTVARGNLSMMRLLVELEANLNGRLVKFNGEPNVTLLYDASYFGHAHLVRFLLQQKGNPDLSVKFQDDMSIMRTPVHIAASLGHSEVVRVLLTAKAQISHPAASGGPPELKDAVDGCHVEVVKLLVQGKADIFSGEEGQRGVDYLFEANNSVLVAAAATGLKLGGQMELSTVEDFIRFLATPDAEEIVPAAFSPCELRSWRGEKRLVWRTAYVLHGDMNVAVGPTRDHFEKQFLQVMERAAASRDNLGEEEEDHLDERFLESLLPHRFEKLPGQSQIPVELFQCLLPGLHRNPEVLWVLSCGVNDRIFDQRGARAIIQVAWKEAELAHTAALIVDTLMAVIFALLALLLHDAEMQRALWLRWPCLAVGSVRLGAAAADRRHSDRIPPTPVTGAKLHAGSIRWRKLRCKAVPATIPFFFVIFCWFAAFIHFYYCFGLQHWWTSSVLLYKLGFLAEVAVEDMLPTSVGTENFWSLPVDVVVMVMSFSMAIILMNLLIGVLAESYNRGWEHRERLFLLERSRFVQR